MKWLVRISVGFVVLVLVLVLVVVGGLFATGNGQLVTLGPAFLFGAPDLPFNPEDAVSPPDYSNAINWAALPTTEDLADLVPAGIVNDFRQGQSPVDVFFIHPTGFLKGSSWVSPMDPDSQTEENTRWMLANQASVYNGCCNVYAPRYREASIFSYFGDVSVREEVLGFAYQDVARAFQYYLTHFNQGRPFVIASHSQGTHHGVQLLKRVIDGTPLTNQMVAAYIIGGGIEKSHFDGMQDVQVCESATDLHCAVHWDTYSEASIDKVIENRKGNVCVNPLSWQPDGGSVGKEQHAGAVVASGVFQVSLSGSDVATGVQFNKLDKPVVNAVEAQCRNGVLYVTDQSGTPFEKTGGGGFGGGNYHGLDYPLFYMDIRENAILKTAVFRQQFQPDAGSQ